MELIVDHLPLPSEEIVNCQSGMRQRLIRCLENERYNRVYGNNCHIDLKYSLCLNARQAGKVLENLRIDRQY